MSSSTLTVLSVLLAVVIVVVLAAALIRIRLKLESTSKTLATLASARRGGVRPPAASRARGQGHQRPVRRDRRGAPGHRVQGRRGGGKAAAMTLEWIGDVILLLVLLPVVIYLLRGVLNAANSIVPSVEKIAGAAQAGSADLDATALLLTTQDQTIKTIAAAADYGGSLDVIIDDA
jgi:hypothetical protein